MLSATSASLAVTKPLGKRKLCGVLLRSRDKRFDELERDRRAALAEFGWVAGQNLTIAWRFADDDRTRLPATARAIGLVVSPALLTRGDEVIG